MSEVEFLTVSSEDADIRLDRWFKRHYPALSHGELQKMLRKGQVKVDGKKAKSNHRLEEWQSIRVPPIDDEAKIKKRQRMNLTEYEIEEVKSWVLYKDDSVIVINKPSGLAVQGGTGTKRHLDGMLDALAFRKERPRLVHRLDKNTSGVLLLARSASVADKLVKSFKSHLTQKTYWALVAGLPSPEEGRLSAPLLKKSGKHGERVVVDDEGKEAVTDYRVIDRASNKVSWLELMPKTGRTHQLRVHCSYLENPVVGDGKYGGEEAFISGCENKLHLHARKITAPHPDGGMIDVEAPLSEHMAASFKFFGFSEKS
ncbi:MAG: RluA family pseudouridine synthase [Alphaproteobacteria bacterium]|nr:RluA family pseudouridine synthase [Alphaproteobacteria bacterium]